LTLRAGTLRPSGDMLDKKFCVRNWPASKKINIFPKMDISPKNSVFTVYGMLRSLEMRPGYRQ